MAITIVEELWGRIRAHIDDKITAATTASESAEAAKAAAEAAVTEAQGTVANVAAELEELAGRAETAATTATTAVAAEVEKLKGDAPEAFDTLGEIAAELAANETERSALTNTIAAKADRVHTHTALEISDATTVGRDVLTAESEDAARQAIGAGTSSLVLGTTSSTAAAGDHTHSQYATTAQVEDRPAAWLWDGVEPWAPPPAAAAGDVVINLDTGAISEAVLP